MAGRIWGLGEALVQQIRYYFTPASVPRGILVD
jgi:hypothetical protein